MKNLPYIDRLFTLLETENQIVEKAVGLNIHSGYWEKPDSDKIDIDNFKIALVSLIEKFLSGIQIQSGQSILDLGCGFGGTIAYLNDTYSNLRLVGLNNDNRQLNRAKKLVAPKNNNTIEWVEADAIELPFIAESFDHLLALESIFHFSSKEQFFSECSRVLKHAGTLTISDFISTNFKIPFLALASTLFWKDFIKLYGPHGMIPTLTTYKRLANSNNFLITSDQDVTKNIRPTFGIFDLVAEQETGEWANSLKRVNQFFRICTHFGLESYHILTFEKNLYKYN